MKYLATLSTLFHFTDYSHCAVFLHYYSYLNIWLGSLRCFSSLNTLTALFCFTTIKIKYVTTLTTLFFFTCFSSLTTLTAVFYFTTTKVKYLTTLTTLFYFTDYTRFAVLLHYYSNKISDYAHYAVFLHWLHSLRCFTSLLFIFKYLTTLITLFFFSDYTRLTVLLHYY